MRAQNVCRHSRVPFHAGSCTNPQLAQSHASSIQVRGNAFEDDDDDDEVQRIPVINQAASTDSREILPAVEVHVPAIEQVSSVENDPQSSDPEAVGANNGEDASTGFDVSHACVDQRLSGVHIDTGELVTGKTVCRAGKTTGKHKYCINIKKDYDNTVSWYDLRRDFSDLQEISD